MSPWGFNSRMCMVFAISIWNNGDISWLVLFNRSRNKCLHCFAFPLNVQILHGKCCRHKIPSDEGNPIGFPFLQTSSSFFPEKGTFETFLKCKTIEKLPLNRTQAEHLTWTCGENRLSGLVLCVIHTDCIHVGPGPLGNRCFVFLPALISFAHFFCASIMQYLGWVSVNSVWR